MNRFIYMLLLFLLFFTFSCSHLSPTEDSNAEYVLPVLKEKPRMWYPPEAQKEELYGTTTVMLTITSEGIVDNTSIYRSSGYDVLDSTALEYCKKFKFIPGKIGDRPVFARLNCDVEFNLTNLSVYAKRYIFDIQSLYDLLVDSGITDKKEIMDRILQEHNAFIENMRDIKNFNSYMSSVILPEINREWKRDWNSWPLTFLLYYDFSRRFKDYGEMPEIKSEILKLLKEDVKFITHEIPEDLTEIRMRNQLLEKIKHFVTKEYSQSTVNDLGF